MASPIDLEENTAVENTQKPEQEASLKPPPPSIPPDSSSTSDGGAGVVSSSSIKRNISIQSVNVRGYAKYMKSKSRDALRHEWDVSIIFYQSGVIVS